MNRLQEKNFSRTRVVVWTLLYPLKLFIDGYHFKGKLSICGFSAVFAMTETRLKLCQFVDLYERKHCNDCTMLLIGIN